MSTFSFGYQDIISFINTIISFPIPDSRYIWLVKWYPYIFTFFAIALILCFFSFKRSGIDENLKYFLWKLPFFAITWILFVKYFNIPVPNVYAGFVFAVICLILRVVLFVITGSEGHLPFEHFQWEDVISNFLKTLCSSFFCIYIIFSFIIFVLPYNGTLPIGQISAEMKYEYNVGEPMSIPISMGGPNTGLHVSLLSDNLGTTKEISYLNLYANSSGYQFNNTLQYNGYLSGTATDVGKYIIYIDSASLSPGFYHLKLENEKYNYFNSEHVFHLYNK